VTLELLDGQVLVIHVGRLSLPVDDSGRGRRRHQGGKNA
jgi:hypothetical protein